MSKEAAQERYDEAYARYQEVTQEAHDELVAAREELEEYLREEEARNAAVFLFGEGADEDESKVEAAKAIAERRRVVKQANIQMTDGPIGGVQ
jgi:hypothetical protein